MMNVFNYYFYYYFLLISHFVFESTAHKSNSPIT